MADNSARIAEIEAILQAGAVSVTIDGVSVTYDFDTLRSELRKLRQADDVEKSRRPTSTTVRLGGF